MRTLSSGHALEQELTLIERCEPNAGLSWTRRFMPVLGCQFFADLGDNFFLNALTFLILFKLGGPSDVALIPLATAALITPSFFLSALGGELADRFDMALVAKRLRLAGIGVSVVAAIGLFLGSVALLFTALILFGVVAALFAPLKYGILPHILTSAELPAGNAFVQGSVFTAVLVGTIAGGLLVKHGDMVLLAMLAIAAPLASWGASLAIQPTGEAAPGLAVRRNVLVSTLETLGHLREDPRIKWGALAICWFWAAGVVVLALLPPLVKSTLGGTEEVLTFSLAVFSIGIAAGSALAARLAAGRIVLHNAIVGAALIGFFAIAVGGVSLALTPPAGVQGLTLILALPESLLVILGFAGLAMSGGLFLVPVMAAVQSWAGADRRARVLAAVNVLTAAAMALAGLATAALQFAGLTPPTLFVLLGIAAVGAAFAIGRAMPRES